jgi:predicted nucleic acid-binding protein
LYVIYYIGFKKGDRLTEVRRGFPNEGKIHLEIPLKGAKIKDTYGLCTVDAVIYAAAQSIKSTLITGDHHFEKLKDVEIL